MSETRLPGEAVARLNVAEHFASLLAQGDRLLAFAVSVISQGGVHVTRTRGIRRLVPKVVFGLYMKACKTYRAILILVRAGLGEDAFTLGVLHIRCSTVAAPGMATPLTYPRTCPSPLTVCLSCTPCLQTSAFSTRFWE